MNYERVLRDLKEVLDNLNDGPEEVSIPVPAADRDLFMEIAWQYYGTWYKWAGDDKSGIDCSGLVVECCLSLGLLGGIKDLNAAGLFKHFNKSGGKAKPARGCLVFYGKSQENISHVGICINDKFMLEAGGGDSKIKTEIEAIKSNAFVKVRPINLRNDIVGYVDPFSKS